MKTLEYYTEDKSSWGPGLWMDEPDKRQWMDEATGIPCLIVRNCVGALCGYAGVPSGHPWHGKSSLESDFPVVHGGITFASSCSHGAPERSICHVVESDEPDDVWWLGFDCAHLYDFIPGQDYLRTQMGFGFNEPERIYRDFSYVTREVESLARQIKEAA